MGELSLAQTSSKVIRFVKSEHGAAVALTPTSNVAM